MEISMDVRTILSWQLDGGRMAFLLLICPTHLLCFVAVRFFSIKGFAESGTVSIAGIGSPFSYSYNPTVDNDNGRTIQGFSTGADSKMRKNGSGDYYVDFQKFFDYYGRYDYADHWIQSAFSSGRTDFPNGIADFTGVSAAGRARKFSFFRLDRKEGRLSRLLYPQCLIPCFMYLQRGLRKEHRIWQWRCT